MNEEILENEQIIDLTNIKQVLYTLIVPKEVCLSMR